MHFSYKIEDRWESAYHDQGWLNQAAVFRGENAISAMLASLAGHRERPGYILRYRELAGEIRRVAQLARFPFARKELIRLAASFEHRANHLGRYED